MPGRRSRPGLATCPRTSTVRDSMLTRASMDGDLALEDLARIGVDADLDGLADLRLADVLLGHREIDVDRIELLQRHDGRAGRNILADIDLAQAERGPKRARTAPSARSARACGRRRRQRNRAARARRRGWRSSSIRRSPAAAGDQARVRRFSRLRDWISGRPARRYRRFAPAAGPSPHPVRNSKVDRPHDAADLRRNIDALHRAERADGRQMRACHCSVFASAAATAATGCGAPAMKPLIISRLHEKLKIGEPARKSAEERKNHQEGKSAFHVSPVPASSPAAVWLELAWPSMRTQARQGSSRPCTFYAMAG